MVEYLENQTHEDVGWLYSSGSIDAVAVDGVSLSVCIYSYVLLMLVYLFTCRKKWPKSG